MYHFLATISLLFSGVLVERKEESRSWLIATTSQKTPSVTSGEQKETKAHYCSLGKVGQAAHPGSGHLLPTAPLHIISSSSPSSSSL